MKKIHSILLGMGLITGGLMLAGWTSGETVTLEEIDTATQTEQLLKNHSSFQITSVYVDDDFTYSQYVDKDLLLVSYPDSTELYLDGQLNYLSEEDSLSGILYILQDPVAYPATDNVIFSSSADETITSCEEKDGKIYVSSDASPEDTEKQVTGEGFPYNEGEYFITDYVLDAETFTLLSLDETLVAPDGSTRPYITATIEYDVERPELAQTMYEHSTAIENLRQVTLTTDPDTENEETFSVQVPKGDGVVIYLPEGYDGIFTDRACTKEEESPVDRNADATLYMAKGK